MAQRTSAFLVAVAILAGATFLNPTSVAAQSSSQGGTFAVGINGGGRWPDAAFDPVNNVYLVVSGNSSNIRGAWVSGDGAPLGAGFAIHDPAPYAQAPRVTYSPDAGGFLVTWHQSGVGNPTAIFSRLVRYNAAWGPPVQVSNGYSAFWEMGAAVAYSTASREFLVAWRGANQAMVFGRRLDANGGLIGNEFTIPATFLQRDPAVGYNPVSNEFIVGFAGYDDFAAHAGFQRIKAGTGEFVGFTNTLGSPSVATYIPEIACTPAGKCLIVWYQRSRTSAVFYGRVVNADGSMTTDAPIPITTAFAFYDALGVAHNQASNAYFLITHSPNSYEDTGLEISPDGVPSPHFLVTNTGNVRGNFNPRVAASGSKAEWLVATSFNLTNIVAQRVGTSSVYPGGGGQPPPPPPPPPPPVTIDLSEAAAPNGSWFLAEGVASNLGGGFDTYYLVENPNTDTDVAVTAYFSKSDGTTFKTSKTIPKGSRATFPLRDIAGLGSFGAVIQSTTPGKQIYVERSIYFGSGWEGSTAETASDRVSTTWYFAEGSRRGEYFNNYFLLFNPTQATASVTATFYTEKGATVTRAIAVGPQSRETLSANDIPELAGLDFSTTFTSNQPVVAERAMYFATTRGTAWAGGMAAIGTNEPASRWLFAEGASAIGFDTYYTVLNPNAYPVPLTVNYLRENGGLYQKTYAPVPANTRFTLNLAEEVGRVGGVSTEFVASGGGIIVERSTYWGVNPGWVEGTTVMGVNSPACEWYVPEGSLIGGFDAYLLIGNPNANSATLNVTLFMENGERYTILKGVGPYQRLSINMSDFFDPTPEWAAAQALLNNSSFSTRVTCAAGSAPVVVEHALYLTPDASNYWRSGSAAFGEAR